MCLNGGTCVTEAGKDSFKCICAEGFTGPTCNETDFGNSLISYLCRYMWTYMCKGYLYPFLTWPLFSGPCNPNPCKNDGFCEIVANSRRGDVFSEYVCKCSIGFDGIHCQNSESLLSKLLDLCHAKRISAYQETPLRIMKNSIAVKSNLH